MFLKYGKLIVNLQECIPVGCVPPAAVAVRGGGSTRHPPGEGPPRADPPLAP